MAYAAPLSMVSNHFASHAFSNYRKGEEGKQKTVLAVLNRLDNLATGLGNLAKRLRR